MPLLTSEYVNIDGGFDGVDGLTHVGARVRVGGALKLISK